MGPWVEFVEDELLYKVNMIKGRRIQNGVNLIETRLYKNTPEYEDKQQYQFRIIYTMINILTDMIKNSMDDFARHYNLKDFTYQTAKMKNEFLYDTILLTDAKKHYQGAVRVREGHLYKEPKFDVKGMEYMKTSMASANTRKFIQNLIYNDILCAKDAQPDIAGILNKIRKFESGIVSAVRSGSREYYKKANIKTMDAYEDPFRIGSFKAAYVWNYLVPNNQIELPGVGYIVKVNANKLVQLSVLADKYPEIFKRFEELFKVEYKTKDIKGGLKIKTIGESGISGIAVPLDTEIPEWLRLIADTTEIIESNTKLLLPVLEALGVHSIYSTKSTQFTGAIVDLD